MSPRTKALLAFGVMAALAGLELWRLAGPAPAPADAPATAFSAARAIAVLHAVFVDAPHPVQTPAHDLVRDRIAAQLRALDYQVEIVRRFACNDTPICGDTDDIIARRPGAPAGKQVVVTAHYDSVPAGPGASDDATGVASVLEIARAIRQDQLANPVVFLIDDGEETGTLGAAGFMADPARSKDAAFFINLEARGTSGAPFLFETSHANRWLIPIVARALPHPASTSLFATIYDLLPNGTDLTVYKRAGRAGINFAYLGDGTQYHTPLDDFAHVDEASVQWRGDQVLAMVRAFGDASLATDARGDAVWFDVFGAVIVWWPAGWSLGLVVLAFALLAGAIVLGARRKQLAARGVALGLASFVASLVVAFAAGSAIAWLLRLRAPGALFEPHPEPMIACAWLAGLAAAIAMAALARRRASFDAVFAGHALAWNLVAAALTMALPGGAYIAVVPGLVMAIAALARALGRAGEPVASTAALVAAAAVLLPFGLVLYDSLGAASVPAVATILALIGTTVAPMLVVRRLILGLCTVAIVLGALAMIVPTTSPSHPRHQALAHVTDSDTGAARWQTDRPLPLVRAAARFERKAVAPWYGSSGTSDVAPALAIAISAPTVHVDKTTRDGMQVVTLELASPRHAPRINLSWRSDGAVESIRVNGVTPPPRPAGDRSYLAPGWHRLLIRGSSARVEIVTRTAAAAEATLADVSFGLPAFAAPLATARDVSGAVPVHDGDLTFVERHVTW
jgi:Peptidase family M28